MHEWTNNARSTFASGITNVALSLTVAAGEGARFPAFTAAASGDITLSDASGNIEYVRCTNRAGDVFTIVRAQQGSAARAWLAGDRVSLRVTKGALDSFNEIGLEKSTVAAGGTVSAMTAAYAKSRDLALANGMRFLVQATGANTITNPTLNVTLGTTATGAKTIVKGSNLPLEVGDIPGADYPCEFQYDLSLDKYVLMNPAKPLYHILGGNLLRNGSFEEDSFGWTLTNFTGGSNTISSASHADGAKSLQFTSTNLANGGGDALSQEYINIGGGELIDFAFWAIGSVAGVSSKVEVHWYDNAKALLSTTVLKQLTSTPTAFTHYGVRQRAPASARWCRMRLTGGIPAVGSTTGSIRFDGVEVQLVDAETAEQRKSIPINLIKLGAQNCAQATTSYMRTLGLTSDGTETNVEFYCYEPFTISELRAFAAAAVPGGQSAVVTLRKNGADTALTATINGGSQTGSDLANSVDFGYGDRFAFKIVTSATAGTNDYQITAKAKKLGKEEGFPAIFLKGTQPTTTRFLPELGGTFDVGGTSNGVHIPVGDCQASRFIWTGANSGSPTSISQRINNVNINNSASTRTDDALSETHSDRPVMLLSEGDRMACTNEAAATIQIGGYIKWFGRNPDTDYDPCYLTFGGRSQAQATTEYMGGYGNTTIATESEVQIPMPACVVKNLRGVIDAVPPAGQTVTVTLRKNGVDTGLAIQYTNAGAITQNDLVDEVVFAAGDLLSFKSVTSATTGTVSHTVSVEAFATLP